MTLVNRLSKEQLLQRLENEDFKRSTLSFYRYLSIEDPLELRNELYQKWDDLNCLGRIYIANDACHLLFIQCSTCAEQYRGCCTEDCRRVFELPPEEQKQIRKIRHAKYAENKIFKSRLRPNLIGP